MSGRGPSSGSGSPDRSSMPLPRVRDARACGGSTATCCCRTYSERARSGATMPIACSDCTSCAGRRTCQTLIRLRGRCEVSYIAPDARYMNRRCTGCGAGGCRFATSTSWTADGASAVGGRSACGRAGVGAHASEGSGVGRGDQGRDRGAERNAVPDARPRAGYARRGLRAAVRHDAVRRDRLRSCESSDADALLVGPHGILEGLGTVASVPADRVVLPGGAIARGS